MKGKLAPSKRAQCFKEDHVNQQIDFVSRQEVRRPEKATKLSQGSTESALTSAGPEIVGTVVEKFLYLCNQAAARL